jgi:hypothetical protein
MLKIDSSSSVLHVRSMHACEKNNNEKREEGTQEND